MPLLGFVIQKDLELFKTVVWEIIYFFPLNLSILSLFTSPQLQFLKEEEVLDKVEIWAQKYLYAHPLWFGSFSAFLVVTDPDYAKALLARGGEKMMPSAVEQQP